MRHVQARFIQIVRVSLYPCQRLQQGLQMGQLELCQSLPQAGERLAA